MRKAFNKLCIKAHTAIENFRRNEKGDTNFISILVILAVAMALAVVFFGFKDNIISWVEETMPDEFE